MRIDIIDILRRDTRTAQGILHRAETAVAVFGGGGDVIGITRHAVTDDFTVNGCAAFFGVFQFFQDEDTGSLTEDETVPVFIEWPARFLRSIVS